MTPTAQKIYDILVDCAKNKTIIYYGELKNMVYPQNGQKDHSFFGNDRSQGYHDLLEVSEYSIQNHNGAILNVLIRRDDEQKKVGCGFWDYAGYCTSVNPRINKQQALNLSDADKKKIQDDETQLVYAQFP